jgi:hypothetical protein
MLDSFLCVLAAIELDAKPQRRTIEIKGIRPDWMLASKAQINDLVASDCAPEFRLGVGHVSAQPPCALGHLRGPRKLWL